MPAVQGRPPTVLVITGGLLNEKESSPWRALRKQAAQWSASESAWLDLKSKAIIGESIVLAGWHRLVAGRRLATDVREYFSRTENLDVPELTEVVLTTLLRAEAIPYEIATIDDVFREVESCHADYAVVPIENSTEGAVGRTLDLLLTTPLKVCGEVVLRIHQHLLSNERSLGEVVKVYSHAQSLAQCHEWLNRSLPNVQRIPVGSNAQAAQLAATEAGAAAIAGQAAAERYQLPELASNIEDEPNNTTRFVVLGRHDAGPSGRDKTSLIMSAHNRTGALAGLLAPISEGGVSMTRLESRPARHTLWEYVFFVDIEGHREDEKVAAALAELERRAAYLKVLGSYPQTVY